MLFRNTFRKIKKSFGRYLSLLVIILIGVGFYAGITISIPNIKDTQTKYYKDTNLMDLKIQSSLGLTDDDVSEISKIDGVEDVVGSYSKDVLVGENVVRIHSIEEDINKVELIKGRMPTNENECLADNSIYKLGDMIKITSDDTLLKYEKYKVVGVVISPIYTSNDYGNTDIGNGKVYSFVYVPKVNFESSIYTEIYLTIDKDDDDIPYADTYNSKVSSVNKKIKKLEDDRIKARIQELMLESSINLDSNSQTIDFNKASWYLMNRDDVVSSYKILESQYNQVITIANVIPIFFILIVALMTSNTMTRMIVEERGEMGTLSSLGFKNSSIIFSYLVYVLSSTVLGTIIGYFVGTIFLPRLVYNCFPVLFPEMEYKFHIEMFVGILIVSCLLMMIVTCYSCIRELRLKPAYLLRPVAPRSGKKVLWERVGFIWKRLSFSSKVTMRNISRYKKRVFMTIVGTMGCTFLIMIGFGIRDSINTIGDKQYSELFKYDNLIILNNNIKEIDSDLEDVFLEMVDNLVLLNQSSYEVVDKNNSLDIYLVVPEDNDQFYTYFDLHDVDDNNKNLKLSDEGVIVTPKIRDRFGVEVGDSITLEDQDKNKYKVKIAGITENYVSNYIYMSDELYERVFDKEVSYNVVVSENIEDEEEIAKELLESKRVLSINFSNDLLEDANQGVSGLNNIVILLVVISSMLAFTVLYNLTSINISERTREIATLKVLGFKDMEANEYIYRETIINVIVGIILGLLITPVLHGFVIDLLEVDNAMFLRQIRVESFVYSACLTFSFAIIMQVVTYYKLKKINMIESLKSVE